MVDLNYLIYELPNDVRKAKEVGDFQLVRSLIQQYLDEDTPDFLKQRLQLELEIIERLEDDYHLDEESMLACIQEEIPDFTLNELQKWRLNHGMLWGYRNGKIHLQDASFESLKKTYPQIQARLTHKLPVNNEKEEVMHDMKKHGSVKYHIHVRQQLHIHDDVFQKENVLVHMPLITTDPCISNIEIHQVSEHASIDEENSARSVVYQEKMLENHDFITDFSYDIQARYINVNPKIVRELCYENDIEEQYPHIRFTEDIKVLAKYLIGNETNPAIIAKKFYRYCAVDVKYAYMPDYFTISNIPMFALNQKVGDCGVKTLLFITLCRYAGIPARWQSGWYVGEQTAGAHDWAKIYMEPYGWIYVDCAYGGFAYIEGNEELYEFYFGNIDPFRMIANQEFQKELSVPKKYRYNDPYDHQDGEVEFESKGLTSNDFNQVRLVVERRKLG
ncbi:MAG: transglutaminase-like domain-containing protein [Erysipelotrichaceae bacterium]|nr:transglutaminase-like domain-containing protein [Erysipelotrichaceae bacterium]